MKHFKFLFLFFLISVTAVAQSGMVFQGIARDNNSAAITNKVMTFTFSIYQGNSPDLFKETQQIRTDNFGVFSHVIGTGSAVTNTFESVNFDLIGLKVKIFVDNNGVNTLIYDQPFQYTAYAKHAQNGVPIGTVVAFMGNKDNLPSGWMLADGRSLDKAEYAQLKAVLEGSNNVPNLQGEFLKGAGTPVDNFNITPVNVRERQVQNVGQHNHNVNINGATNSDGLHKHQIKHTRSNTVVNSDSDGYQLEFGAQDVNNASYWNSTGWDTHNNFLYYKWASEADSQHAHNFTVNGTTGQRQNQAWAGDQRENRPDNVGVYWIIRFK